MYTNKKNNFIMLAAGIFSIAVSVIVFFEPNNIVVGGFSGLGIIINRSFGIPVWISNIILNIPLFLFGFKIMGRRYILKSAVCAFGLSAAFNIAAFLPEFKGDIMLVLVYGALFDGLGTGLVLKSVSSTGGVDLLASIVHSGKQYLSISAIIFVINSIIIMTGLFVFGSQRALYAVIAAFISGKISGIVLDGLSFSKAAVIISEKSEDIAESLMRNIERGVTAFKANGMYTGNEKNVLLCVFGYKETSIVKDIVRSIDSNAFLIVTDVKEVLGEGFKDVKH